MEQDTDLLELFHVAADLPPAEQRAFIEERCGHDPELRARLERLLDLDRERSGSFLRCPLGGAETEDLVGRVFDGKYRIVGLLGEGGMGVVYLAEQERPRRQVALKLVRPGLATEHQLRRFELETEMLARLGHPGIAQIYDVGNAGSERSPRPYFAMEYVRGLPLLEHAAQSGLDTRQRLELVAELCDAVEHAHQRGIIHRDLKPGNILVDESGRPKILDFGVARVIEPDVQASTLHTGTGQLLGTLAYMSPEQVLGRASEIDARSDVYALGVVLFQLLSDRLPYDLRDRTLAAAARVISEEEPDSLTTVNRSFRGDLDTIVRTALEKEPQRRYQSAAVLGGDIRRYLSNEPIVARPATTMYQLRKFARRNRALVSGIATTFVVLVAGVAASTTLAIGQTRALAESERQRKAATAINEFFTEDLIELADPHKEADRDITLSEALDRAVVKIEERFVDAPLAEADIRHSIGRAYRHLHRLDEAEFHLNRAMELYREHGGDLHEKVLLCRMELVAAVSNRGDFAEAEPEIRELLRLQREHLGDDHEQTMASINNLAGELFKQGRFEEALPLMEEALERRLRVLGEYNEHTATTMNNLGVLQGAMGDFERSTETLARTLDVLLEVKGDRYPQTLQTMANLGMGYYRLDRVDEGVEMLERAVPLYRDVLGEDHRETLAITSSLATMYGRSGRLDEKESLLAQTLAVQREEFGEDSFDTLVSRMNLIGVAQERGGFEAAATEYADVVARFAANYPDHYIGSIARSKLGACLMELGRYEKSETELKRAYDHLVETIGASHRDTLVTASKLADLYDRWEKADEAAIWRRIADGGKPD